MIDPALGPPNRPLLVLSCVSHVSVKRIPCVYVAHQLQLNLLRQPWMVLALKPLFSVSLWFKCNLGFHIPEPYLPKQVCSFQL